MQFGRQNNLARRPVRPDGAVNRQLRRGKGKASLLDIQTSSPPRESALGKLLRRAIAAITRR